MLLCQPVAVTSRGENPERVLACQELHCQAYMPVKDMSVWRVWAEAEQRWKYYPFCGDLHALHCLQPAFLPKG
jgi:hypothetical protein